MNTGTKQRLEAEHEWRKRIEDKIDGLYDKFADDGQLRANCSFIFAPKGPWEQYAEKVLAHETTLQRANGVMLTMLAIGLTSLLAWGKAIIQYFRHPQP